MSKPPIWKMEDGRTMARCPDCNAVFECRRGAEQAIEVGPKGQVTGVICEQCFVRLERSGMKIS